jgi:shikimate 5-dehydrogenase
MVVYDIIYDPIKTVLIKTSEEIGLRTLNGLRMNLIQAVLAYSYTNPTSLTKEEIFKIMS